MADFQLTAVHDLTTPCQCWHAAAVTMHHGHCCFDGNLTDYTPYAVPCGHYHGIPYDQIPATNTEVPRG